MTDFTNVVVIVPSLNPDEKLNLVVEGAIKEGFKRILLVNDGSDQAHMEPFNKAALHPEVTVLTHEVNKGKGRALKTAFSYIVENIPDCPGAITVDGDNQHTPHDMANCSRRLVEEGDKMVLGCRDFDDPSVPWKSKAGNKITRFVFRYLCGIKITDTQTGLRAFPMSFLPTMIETTGERFEYETEMFFSLKRNDLQWVEETIDTVYIEDNASSHFNPFRDSFKIYRIILRNVFRYLISSLSAFAIDYGIFNLLNILLSTSMQKSTKLFIATFTARVISSFYNYNVNRKLVFKSEEKMGKTMVRYYILCVCQTALSYGLVFLLSTLCGAGTGLEAVLKLLVDILLFLFSFRIQQGWVFKK